VVVLEGNAGPFGPRLNIIVVKADPEGRCSAEEAVGLSGVTKDGEPVPNADGAAVTKGGTWEVSRDIVGIGIAPVGMANVVAIDIGTETVASPFVTYGLFIDVSPVVVIMGPTVMEPPTSTVVFGPVYELNTATPVIGSGVVQIFVQCTTPSMVV
jgi:hypothetical protein